jgi:hypothetical protein
VFNVNFKNCSIIRKKRGLPHVLKIEGVFFVTDVKQKVVVIYSD